MGDGGRRLPFPVLYKVELKTKYPPMRRVHVVDTSHLSSFSHCDGAAGFGTNRDRDLRLEIDIGGWRLEGGDWR
jgi:hypothetical protein